MALSTALFGLYFKVMLPNQNNASNPDVWFTLNAASPGTESSMSWLAVVSLGLFVAGKWNRLLGGLYPTPKLLMNVFPFVTPLMNGNELMSSTDLSSVSIHSPAGRASSLVTSIP